MSATMPSASGPHSCMTRSESAHRNCAPPRVSLRKASAFSPRNVSIFRPPAPRPSADSPTRWRNGTCPAARAASFFSGTAWASWRSRTIPAGSVCARNSMPLFSQSSRHLRRKVISPLFQRPRAEASNSKATPPAAASVSRVAIPGRPARASQSPAISATNTPPAFRRNVSPAVFASPLIDQGQSKCSALIKSRSFPWPAPC